MVQLVFTCPVVSKRVQQWLDDDEDVPGDNYVGVDCLACGRMHFINRKTGKLFGQDEQ
jgi:hypothetical protein